MALRTVFEVCVREKGFKGGERRRTVVVTRVAGGGSHNHDGGGILGGVSKSDMTGP